MKRNHNLSSEISDASEIPSLPARLRELVRLFVPSMGNQKIYHQNTHYISARRILEKSGGLLRPILRVTVR